MLTRSAYNCFSYRSDFDAQYHSNEVWWVLSHFVPQNICITSHPVAVVIRWHWHVRQRGRCNEMRIKHYCHDLKGWIPDRLL